MARSPARALLIVLAAGAAAALAAPSRTTLVDRVVAVVDEDPILLSDLERAIGLGLVPRAVGESDEALSRRALDALVEQKLRLHEIARFGVEDAPLDEVDRQLERLRARFPDEKAWQAELARLGLVESEVRQILARQLSVLAYVEQRLGPRVYVGVEEIRTYYDDELVPKLRAAGEPVPPVEEVRESIRAVLREARLDAEIERWTADLRRQADVIDLLDAGGQGLPPVQLVVPASPPRS
jgi:hypothetical protein